MRIAGYCLALMIACTAIGSSALPAKDKPSDPRLSKLVTIESTGERLHTVLARISSITGVKILCGDDSSDWRVRDIPIVVCARNLPLGKLLEGVADCTYLRLSTEKAGKAFQYRIWRDAALKKELAEYPDARRRDALAAAAWDWDVSAACTIVPEAALDPPWHGIEKQVPRILSALGPKARDEVLAGKVICLCIETAPPELAAALTNTFRTYYDATHDSPAGEGEDLNTTRNEEMRRFFCRISLVGGWESTLEVAAGVPERAWSYCVRRLSNAAYRADPSHVAPCPSTLPDPYAAGVYENPSKAVYALFDDKIDISNPQAYPKRAGIVVALSRAANLSIVCEDFMSHLTWPVRTIQSTVSAENLLAGLSSYKSWKVDVQNRTVIGHDRWWRGNHINLVPVALTENLSAKLRGPGAGLDDIAPLYRLTEGEHMQWTWSTEPLGVSKWPNIGILVTLYSWLTSKQRARIWGDIGCPLEDANPRVVAEMWAQINVPESTACNCGGDPRADRYLPLDAARLKRLFLKGTRGVSEPGKPPYDRLSLVERKDGQETVLLVQNLEGLPMFTDKRRAELDRRQKPRPMPEVK